MEYKKLCKKSLKSKNVLKRDIEHTDSSDNNNKKRKEICEVNYILRDFFSLHFNVYIGEELAKLIENPSTWTSEFHQLISLGRIMFESPKISSSSSSDLLLNDRKENSLIPSVNFPNQFELCNLSICSEILEKIQSKKMSNLQMELFSIMCQYVDIYFPEATYNQWDNIKFIYSIHCINHIIKTRNHIIDQNERLASEKNEDSIIRDQGFTRTKILILLPFKHSAYKVIKVMSSFFGNILKKKKFEREYGPPDPSNASAKRAEKPKDFQEIFSGDIDEDFIIGLTITKKSLKLYSELYESDIIIGSPLGVRFAIETSSKTKETDFLSSIEIFILDQADIFQMQNWEHILIIMESLNQSLQDIKKLHSDVMRIRLDCLEGFSKMFRQTLVFASTVTDLNRTLVADGKNYAGKIQVLNFVKDGSATDVHVRSELILQRVKNMDNCFCPDSHFKHFTQHILPQLRLCPHSHTLIYVPDYCDYIRLVKYMKEDGGTSIATINEYMIDEPGKVAKAKSLFFDGKKQYLMYTERMHFYKRYNIKGIQHILFYGLPTYPHFFSEICNLMSEEFQNPKGAPIFGLNTITALYQPIEVTKLIGVLGTQKAAAVVRSDKTVHMCTIGPSQ